MSTDKLVGSEISSIIELCTDSCGNTKKSGKASPQREEVTWVLKDD